VLSGHWILLQECAQIKIRSPHAPLAGVFTAIIVLVALYGLTPAFFWIPSAGLSAVIIHAVADLVAKPSQVYSFWRVSPIEFVIWLAAVLVTVFSSIENGIYTSICASFALLIIRVAHPRGHFMGKVTLQSDPQESKGSREVFVPLNPSGVVNPQVKVDTPLPGVVIYRFEESFLYPNSSLVDSALVDYVKAHTRRGQDMTHVKYSDRPWNDPGPGHFGAAAVQAENERKPTLHAIVLDFSGVYVKRLTFFLGLVLTSVLSLQFAHRYDWCPIPYRYTRCGRAMGRPAC
jgi:sodium-independent sulfate anion transporter 11